ncbi:L-type lectin-domain containing receptor kinase SIT2-like [Magnolia sinica]|uniref:L-type lectin-domain containing receptor kinase SIT2-like n=1 Tax=Magnolia sinica TaxID=86752 RepID=UPI002659A2C7|nr:L-type lectin-domain containing receptor kinase SIT2-like [Magnolia sinica]
MLLKVIPLFLIIYVAASQFNNFIFNGFYNPSGGESYNLSGGASITSTGHLKLTNGKTYESGHAFFSTPLSFKNSSNGNVFSFSTTFIFAIGPDNNALKADGMAFVISPSNNFPGALPGYHLGLFNFTNDGDRSNHVVAVELDTIMNLESGDIDSNHVGIDIDGLNSINSSTAGYFSEKNGRFKNLSLTSGEPMQVWVEYNGIEKQLNVTLYPISVPKPNRPLLSLSIDLSSIILDSMYVGFSSATGILVASHYVLGWSFQMNGEAPAINVSSLASLPWKERSRKKSKVLITVALPVIVAAVVLITILGIVFMIRRKKKSAEVLEDWELDYGPHRFSYKDLSIATKGFADKELLGTGGFGKVYRGVLPISKIEVAVKRVSHESRQGMREFVAEVVSLGRLKHRNLVQLLGYCRCKQELLLVYDLMHNGSLDKYLFDQPQMILDWSRRYEIIKGVASGLLYLHEDWEQVVIHRDIKASNVLLDGEMNGRLGDFGLARLYGHGSIPQTTHVAGTLGYLAPELTKTGKATTSTDVFAFGVFMLEVACGRRPIERHASAEESILVDWVLECWRRRVILDAADLKLESGYVAVEMELVMKLGLLCSHPHSAARPTMRRVMQYLDRDAPLPELFPDDFVVSTSALGQNEGFDDLSSIQASILSGGR